MAERLGSRTCSQAHDSPSAAAEPQVVVVEP